MLRRRVVEPFCILRQNFLLEWQEGCTKRLQHAVPSQPASQPASPQSVFVKNVSAKSSAAPILLGMMNFFKREVPRVGFFNPVKVEDRSTKDGLSRHVHLMKHACDMPDDPNKMVVLDEAEALQLLSSGRQTEFLDRVFAAFNEYKASHDVVVVNGWRDGGLAVNALMAAHLSAPAVLVVDYEPGQTNSMIYDLVMAEAQEYMALRAEVLGVIVNKVPSPRRVDLHEAMTAKFAASGVAYLGALPFSRELAEIRLDQIFHSLNGRLLFSQPGQVNLDTHVRETFVATTQCGRMLQLMRHMERPLVITASDRVDIVNTCLGLHMSGAKPIAGVMIADHDGTPTESRADVQAIFDGLERQAEQSHATTWRLPIFMTSKNVFDAVKTIGNIKPCILASSHGKIEAAKSMFDSYVDTEALKAGLAAVEDKLTPSKFLYSIRQRCKDQPQRIVLPESHDHRVLAAASQASQRGLAHITLLGNEDHVLAEAGKVGLDMTGVSVVDPQDHALRHKLAVELAEARKKKGLSFEAATELLDDLNMFGTMIVRAGLMDGMVSGATHTTAATIRPGMQVLKNPSMPLVSSVFFMCLPDKVLVYGDCAVNVEPSAEQLALIAIASAETAAAFGIQPRVAMLSYSTLGSGSGPQVEKVLEATRLAQAKRPDLKIDGPMQYDAATNPRIAAVKVKNDVHGVAGNANVLIFPDLNTGNNTYKAVQQASGAIAMGPIMQGLSMPVNDLSRGATVADILDTICATSLQALFKKVQAKQ